MKRPLWLWGRCGGLIRATPSGLDPARIAFLLTELHSVTQSAVYGVRAPAFGGGLTRKCAFCYTKKCRERRRHGEEDSISCTPLIRLGRIGICPRWRAEQATNPRIRPPLNATGSRSKEGKKNWESIEGSPPIGRNNAEGRHPLGAETILFLLLRQLYRWQHTERLVRGR